MCSKTKTIFIVVFFRVNIKHFIFKLDIDQVSAQEHHILMIALYNIHLLDSAEPDIRFVVQIEVDVGRSEAESNISLDLHNKSNVRRGYVQQMFYDAEITE